MESLLEGGLFYIHLFRSGGAEGKGGGGARETRLSDNMTLGWKRNDQLEPIQKCCQPSKRLTDVSTRSQAVGPLNVNISTNVKRPLKR